MLRTLLILVVAVCFLPRPARADDFDNYTNTVLEKVPKARGALPVKALTPALLAEHSAVLANNTAALLVVKTNDGRWSKLLVYPAQQKLSDDKSLPILLIERFVTYQEGEEQAVVVQGSNIRLFDGFHFNLDIGQVVPASVGGDIHFTASKGQSVAKPTGKAEFYLITKPLPEAKPAVSDKVVIGAQFQPKHFQGVYKLYDDGRRTGTLHLKVRDDGVVLGHFFSGKDGKKYDVEGKVADPHHKINFKVTYPRTVQYFQAWMFTGDGKVMTGSATMEKRETGFYAVRVEAEPPKVKKDKK